MDKREEEDEEEEEEAKYNNNNNKSRIGSRKQLGVGFLLFNVKG